jgi:phosphatidate cytidylyltransferase
MKYRIMSALVVILCTYAAMWYDAAHGIGWAFSSVMALLVLAGLREFYRMAKTQGWRPFTCFGMVMSVLLVFLHERWCLEKWHGASRLSPDLMSTLIAAITIGCFLLQLTRETTKGAIGNVATTLLGLIYVWFLPSFLVKIRHLGIPGGWGWQYDGVEMIFVAITVAKTSDVGALLVGSKLGKHKMCPTLSPKKTWEGAAGGIFFSVALICAFVLFEPSMALAKIGWGKLVGLGVLLAVSAMLGDLVESAFKRDSEIKDAGGGVPGFGGVLDLIDSLMISSPAMYFYLIVCCGAKAGWG